MNENKITVSCNLDVILTVCEEKTEKILVSSMVKEGVVLPTNEGKITVYYPDSSDTLFSVAKRFRTSTEKVALDNDLTERVFVDDGEGGKLVGVRRLLIY